MAITRKAGPAQSVTLAGYVPDPPRVPDEVVDRFDSMAVYQRQIDSWWSIYKGLFQRDMDEIRTQFLADETSTSASIASIQSALTTIQQQLTSLLGTGGTSVAAQLVALAAQLQTIADALSVHIAATKAHGTTGDIVGTTDSQVLDNKQIGVTTPGYGRFWPPVGVGNISTTQSVTIAVGEYSVVAGPFTVYGQLIVEGTLVSL